MYEINFEIPAFLLSLLCLIYCLTAKRRQYMLPKTAKELMTSQHFMFLLMLIANILSSVSSVAGVYLTEATFPRVAVWQYLFHAFYFVFHSTLSITFTMYIMNVTGTGSNWNKVRYVLFMLPYLVAEILILTNSFTKWCFYMDESLVYHRGVLMPVLYALGGIYVVLAFIYFIRNRKAITKSDSLAVGLFIGIATLGIAVQGLYSKFLVELFCEAAACLVIMIVLEIKGGHIDATTGLFNRLAFVDENRKLMATGQHYQIVLIKLRDYEKILKRYGNRDAESYLIQFAAFLMKEAGVLEVYCYLRENFAVIYKGSATQAADAFVSKVLEMFNSQKDMASSQVHGDATILQIKVPQEISSFDELENLIANDTVLPIEGTYLVPHEQILELSRYAIYESALREAISEKKLMIKFQPIWSAKERRTISAEALLRVDCDELRHVSPDIYIPIAERTGLIHEIGLFVFEKVCRFLKNEKVKEYGIDFVELNLSVYQFMYEFFGPHDATSCKLLLLYHEKAEMNYFC